METRFLYKLITIIVLISTIVACVKKNAEKKPVINKPHYNPKIKDTMIVSYQGRKFVFDKNNPSYNANQAAKVALIIENAIPPELYSNYKEVIMFYRELKCPGCGGSTGGFGQKTALGQFTFIAVEIPKKNQFRVFIYRLTSKQKEYALVDSFYYKDSTAPLLTFTTEGNRLIYSHQKTKNHIKSLEISPKII